MTATAPPTAPAPPLDSAPSGVRWATEPFVMGTPEQFAKLRRWLDAVHYTERELCEKAGAPSLAELKSLEAGRTALAQPVDAQSLLVLLFLDGAHIPWDTVRSVLSADELANLTDLGLLQPAVSNADNCVGTVSLFPVENIYVVSDRLSRMEVVGGPGIPPDLVYSPLTKETRRFVRMMPRLKCESYLELCAGTGIAALLAAKQFAGRAVSADITERSTRFARFNGALNALPNFEAVQGDMYAPVEGQTFDIISAHPPYVPAESTAMVFRDGGEDGEQITRRVLAGVAEHLNPGGMLYIDCMMTERVGEPLERRVRRMLGPEEEDFDVLVFRSGMVDARTYVADRLVSGRSTPDEVIRQNALFKRLGIEQLVAATTLIQRRSSQRPVVTRHRTTGSETSAEDLLWLLRFLTGLRVWGQADARRILDSRPRTLPRTELRQRWQLGEDGWSHRSSSIATSEPFAVEAPCPAWFPRFLEQCDGKRTVGEHLARLRADGSLSDTTTDEDFMQFMRELADVPFIELDDFPLPRPAR